MSPLYDPSRFVDHYEVLGVPPTAPKAQITQRYLFLRAQAEAREGLASTGAETPGAAGDPGDRVWQAVSRFYAFKGRARAGAAAPEPPSLDDLNRAHEVLGSDRARAAYDSARRQMRSRAVSVVGGRAPAQALAH